MGRVTVAGGKVGMEAPSTGIALSTLAEGSIVKLNENGSPVEFYVAKHDYESALNGAGRTLLVRKDCHSSRIYDSGSYNEYATSDIDPWLNGTYKNLLDSTVQNAMGTTSFYGEKDVQTLSRSVFMLSLTEFGLTSYGVPTLGSVLSIASKLLIAYLNGSAVTQWTRSPSMYASTGVSGVSATGTATGCGVTESFGVRPCFTIPATALFDEETLEFKGAA